MRLELDQGAPLMNRRNYAFGWERCLETPVESRSGPAGVVLVDNDAALLNALKFALETEGFSVRAFSDASAVLAGEPESRACYVLDQNLPGMTGLELLSRLRSRGRDDPAILIATQLSAAAREQARAMGAVIVEKPLLGDALACEVRRAIERIGAIDRDQ